jgi:hypothetical protein
MQKNNKVMIQSFLFNKIGEDGRTGSAWKRGWWAGEGGGKGGDGGRGRNGPNNVCTYELKKYNTLRTRR